MVSEFVLFESGSTAARIGFRVMCFAIIGMLLTWVDTADADTIDFSTQIELNNPTSDSIQDLTGSLQFLASESSAVGPQLFPLTDPIKVYVQQGKDIDIFVAVFPGARVLPLAPIYLEFNLLLSPSEESVFPQNPFPGALPTDPILLGTLDEIPTEPVTSGLLFLRNENGNGIAIGSWGASRVVQVPEPSSPALAIVSLVFIFCSWRILWGFIVLR